MSLSPSPPPMPPTPADYAALRRYLDSPPPTVIADWAEFFHRHDAPDDPEWPAPNDGSLFELTTRVGVPVLVMALIVAIERPLAAGVVEADVAAKLWPGVAAMRDALADFEMLPDAVELFVPLVSSIRRADDVEVSPIAREFLNGIDRLGSHYLDWLVGSSVRAMNVQRNLRSDEFGEWWRCVRARVPLGDVGKAGFEGQSDVLVDAVFSPREFRGVARAFLHRGMDARAVTAIRQRLADADPAVRQQAAELLGEIPHPAAISLLQKTLATDENLAVREAAAHALGTLKQSLHASPDEIFSALRDALAHPRREVRAAALASLDAATHPDLQAISIAALADKAQLVRVQAVYNLRHFLDDPAVCATLIATLTTDKPDVQIEAATVMSKQGRTEFIAPLAAVLQSTTHAEVQTRAIAALGRIADAAIVPPLVAFLPRATDEQKREVALALGFSKSPDAVAPLAAMLRGTRAPLIVSRVVSALGSLEHPAAFGPLREQIENFKPATWDQFFHYHAVIAAMGRIRSEESFEWLAAIPLSRGPFPFASHPDDAAHAAQSAWVTILCAIARCDARRASRLLLDRFRAGDAGLRVAVVRALGEVRASMADDPPVREMLALALADDSAAVREAAVWVAVEIPAMRGAIVERLADSAPFVRIAAVRAVGAHAMVDAVDAVRILFSDPVPDVRAVARECMAQLESQRR